MVVVEEGEEFFFLYAFTVGGRGLRALGHIMRIYGDYSVLGLRCFF